MGEGYDPSTFYIHSTDKRGHSKTVRFSMPPDHLHRIQNFIADRRYPYQTQQDFIRDAIVHRINSLAENDETLTEIADVFTRSQHHAALIARAEASDNLVSIYRELAGKLTGGNEQSQLMDDIRDDIANADRLGLTSGAVDQLKDLLNRIHFGAVR